MRSRRPQASSAETLLPRDRIARLVSWTPDPVRQVPWWPLVKSVMGLGAGFAVLFLGGGVALLLDVVGAPLPASTLGWSLAGTVAVAVVVDLARLLRYRRIARHGVLATARVDPGPGRRLRLGGETRRRTVDHPEGQQVRDRTPRLPEEAPAGPFEQSVLVHPRRPQVWLTLTRIAPVEVAQSPHRAAVTSLSGLPPLKVGTLAGRMTAAFRVGFWTLTVGVMGAAVAVEVSDDPRWWTVAGLGPLAGIVAAGRVALWLDGAGVRLRSALWTRSRPWTDLERLHVGEALILPGRYGSGITTPVLVFEDHLGVRMRAIATVRCWRQSWLAEVVRRCQAVGVEVDGQVLAAVGSEQGPGDRREARSG